MDDLILQIQDWQQRLTQVIDSITTEALNSELESSFIRLKLRDALSHTHSAAVALQVAASGLEIEARTQAMLAETSLATAHEALIQGQ